MSGCAAQSQYHLHIRQGNEGVAIVILQRQGDGCSFAVGFTNLSLVDTKHHLRLHQKIERCIIIDACIGITIDADYGTAVDTECILPTCTQRCTKSYGHIIALYRHRAAVVADAGADIKAFKAVASNFLQHNAAEAKLHCLVEAQDWRDSSWHVYLVIKGRRAA